MKKDLLEIESNVFVNRYDPKLIPKLLRYHPYDSLLILKYAEQLEENGRWRESLYYYKKAARLGSAYATSKLVSLEEDHRGHALGSPPFPPRKRGILLFWVLMLIFTLILLSLLLFGQKSLLNWHQTSVVHAKTLYVSDQNTTAVPKTAEALQTEAVLNALWQYKQQHGQFPANLQTLTGTYPNNYLSQLPAGVQYHVTQSGFQFSKKGLAQPLNGNTHSHLALAFYPSVHKLALLSGQTPLATFTVASGKSLLPPVTSHVTQRVTLPNGGKGGLGTRGLALTGGFAIHGTDHPELIGQSVSHGCLRLHNSDVERLYPYVSIGTPFYVFGGSPSRPVFKTLPSWSLSSRRIASETTASPLHWKG